MAAQQFHPGEVVDFKVELDQASGVPTDVWDKVRGVTYTLTHPDSAQVVDEDQQPLDGQIRFTSVTPEGEDGKLTAQLDGDPSERENLLTLESETWEVVDGPAVAGRILILRPVQPSPPA